jgi:hypothetical protein
MLQKKYLERFGEFCDSTEQFLSHNNRQLIGLTTGLVNAVETHHKDAASTMIAAASAIANRQELIKLESSNLNESYCKTNEYFNCFANRQYKGLFSVVKRSPEALLVQFVDSAMNEGSGRFVGEANRRSMRQVPESEHPSLDNLAEANSAMARAAWDRAYESEL